MKKQILCFMCVVFFMGCVPQNSYDHLLYTYMDLYKINTQLQEIIKEQDKGQCKVRVLYLQREIETLQRENESLKLKIKILEHIDRK
jgi:hypothetical protein